MSDREMSKKEGGTKCLAHRGTMGVILPAPSRGNAVWDQVTGTKWGWDQVPGILHSSSSNKQENHYR